MSVLTHYHRCLACMERPVEIRTHDGAIHRGIITNVNRSRVFLRPIGHRNNIGGFGYGFRGGFGGLGGFGAGLGGFGTGLGGYGGFGYGGGFGVALAAIAGIGLLSRGFW